MRSDCKVTLLIIFYVCVINVVTQGQVRTPVGQDVSNRGRLSLSGRVELPAVKKTDKERRDDILAVVNNSLSTEDCKKAVLGQLGDGKQCLRDGCATLEHLKDLVSVVGCTSEDYDKLHAVICVPSDPPCTTAPPSPQTTENIEDEKRREEILNVVNNSLSSEKCKNIVLAQLKDGKQCLRDGCATLEGYKTVITLVGCTSEDYDKLHAVICVTSDPPCPSSTLASSTVVGVGTTKGPGISHEQAQRNQIKCTIEKQMSSKTCKDVVKSQTSDNDDLGGGCTKLESFANSITAVGCTQADYDKLHDVICHWDGTERCIDYVQKQKDAIAEIENGLSNSCNKSIFSSIRSANLTTYCANIQHSKNILLSSGSCGASEIGNLTNFVCCIGSLCFEPGADPSTRKGQVTLAIHALSDPCARTMKVAIDEFSQTPKVACKALEDTKSTLLNAGVCSEKDYTRLSEVVCKSDDCDNAGGCTTAYDPYPSEKPQRDIIQGVIFNDVQETCKNFMTDVGRQQIADPLEKTCRSFLDNHGFIVIGGQCSEEDYKKLKVVICAAGKAEANAAILIIGAIFVFVKTVL